MLFVDNNPTSLNAARQAHGRVEAISLVLRAMVSMAFVAQDLLSPWLSVTFLLVSSSLLTLSNLYYLPFYSMAVNRLFVVSYAFFWWACLCLPIAQLVGSHEDYGAISALAMGILPFMFTVSVLVDRRAESLAAMKPTALTSPYMVELIMRFKFFGSDTTRGGFRKKEIDQATLEHQWRKAEREYRVMAEGMFSGSVFLNLHFAALARNIGANELLGAI